MGLMNDLNRLNQEGNHADTRAASESAHIQVLLTLMQMQWRTLDHQAASAAVDKYLKSKGLLSKP